MQTYETIFITPPDLPPQKLDDFLEKLKGVATRQGGEVLSVEKWGRRRLAYPIRRQREGFYVLVTFKAPSATLAELNQFYRVSDDVLRQLTCKVIPSKPREGAPAKPAAERPAAPEPAPAGAPPPL